ncbi:MAG TPA: hypothetical protein VK738_09495 [Terriglobales bacterium]|nr:hypothetical protein [Terriglobales bacterium]
MLANFPPAKIHRMATYGYSEQHIENMVGRNLMIRRRVCVIALTVLACLLAFYVSVWFFGAHDWLPTWVVPVLLGVFLHPLINYIRSWKNYRGKLEESLRKMKVEISPERISMFSSSLPVRQLERSEIQRAEDASLFGGGGFYLRTPNRYRWLLIPREIESCEIAKSELIAMGIPIMTKSLPPNWEEFVGVLGFCTTLMCPLFAHSKSVLTVNLLLSLLVALAMFFIISANPDNLPRMRWVRFFGFLPVVVTGLMLWL